LYLLATRPTLKAHFSGALFMGIFIGRFSSATFTGAGVAAPRHNYTRAMTIDKMLGFGRGDPISLL
jgi:hypothetical protein